MFDGLSVCRNVTSYCLDDAMDTVFDTWVFNSLSVVCTLSTGIIVDDLAGSFQHFYI